MCGMLTYQDFSFLLNLLSTPRRYLDIGFHCFDVSADGNIEAKVNHSFHKSLINLHGIFYNLLILICPIFIISYHFRSSLTLWQQLLIIKETEMI